MDTHIPQVSLPAVEPFMLLWVAHVCLRTSDGLCPWRALVQDGGHLCGDCWVWHCCWGCKLTRGKHGPLRHYTHSRTMLWNQRKPSFHLRVVPLAPFLSFALDLREGGGKWRLSCQCLHLCDWEKNRLPAGCPACKYCVSVLLMFCPTSSLIICSSWLSPGLLWSQQITLLRGDAYRSWALQRGKDGTKPRRCVLLEALYPTIWGKRSCAGLQHLFLCAVVPKHLPGRRRRLKGMVAIFLWKAFLGAFLVTNHIFWLYQGDYVMNIDVLENIRVGTLMLIYNYHLTYWCSWQGQQHFLMSTACLLNAHRNWGERKVFCTLTNKLSASEWRSPCNNSEQLSEGG